VYKKKRGGVAGKQNHQKVSNWPGTSPVSIPRRSRGGVGRGHYRKYDSAWRSLPGRRACSLPRPRTAKEGDRPCSEQPCARATVGAVGDHHGITIPSHECARWFRSMVGEPRRTNQASGRARRDAASTRLGFSPSPTRHRRQLQLQGRRARESATVSVGQPRTASAVARAVGGSLARLRARGRTPALSSAAGSRGHDDVRDGFLVLVRERPYLPCGATAHSPLDPLMDGSIPPPVRSRFARNATARGATRRGASREARSPGHRRPRPRPVRALAAHGSIDRRSRADRPRRDLTTRPPECCQTPSRLVAAPRANPRPRPSYLSRPPLLRPSASQTEEEHVASHVGFFFVVVPCMHSVSRRRAATEAIRYGD
jgi:hypothetical protein